MPITGPLVHIDISIGYPEKSIPFYAAFFEALGYRRWNIPQPDFQEPNPRRATWVVKYPDGARFAIEIRPARPESRVFVVGSPRWRSRARRRSPCD